LSVNPLEIAFVNVVSVVMTDNKRKEHSIQKMNRKVLHPTNYSLLFC